VNATKIFWNSDIFRSRSVWLWYLPVQLNMLLLTSVSLKRTSSFPMHPGAWGWNLTRKER